MKGIKDNIMTIRFMEIKDWMIEKAEKKSKKMGVLKNSITSGYGNVAGFIGEEIIKRDLGEERCKSTNSYNHDIIFKDKIKIEVKTKRTTVEPQDYYDCSVSNFNTKQKCDLYAFVRVNIEEKEAWILGYCSKKRYMNDSVFRKKGEKDPSNGFVFKADCWNMKIRDLNDWK